MTTQEIHEISGRILTLESKCEQYKYYIEQISADNKKLLESDLTICVNSKRSQTRINISPQETITLLRNRLQNYESELSQLKKNKDFLMRTYSDIEQMDDRDYLPGNIWYMEY